MTKHTSFRARRVLPVALAAFAVLTLGGCEKLLEVNDPDIVTPDNLTDDLGLQTLRNGAISNFQQAWSAGQANDNLAVVSGLFSDEWMHSGTFPTRQEMDRREIQIIGNGTMEGLFFRLQRARADLERAAIRIERSVPDPTTDDRIPEMLAYAGFTYVGFGENYCSGVPFSETIDSILYGDPLTTTQMFEQAVAHFDAAIGHPAASTDIQYLARIGKGRALLSLDRATEAAAAVENVVPDDWVWYNYHSNTEGRTRNGIYHLNPEAGRWSVAEGEGGNGLAFRSSGDPRVPWSDIGVGFDSETPLYQFDVYQAREDRFPLATGVEARLIEAEAALQGGGNWLTILNDLRASFATLGPLLYPDNPPSGSLAALTDPGSATAREDLLFAERAYWLYSTAHRLGDLRRLVRQYGRGAESVFPTGAYMKGGSYGADVNFPVPQPEENNPNFAQCLDRNP